MKGPAFFAGLCSLLSLSACIPPIPNLAPKLYLHPVQGPMASPGTGTAIIGVATGFGSDSISFQLPTGESCQGPWQPVPQNQGDLGLASSWDLVYGDGYFTHHVLGTKWRGSATLRGDKGSEFKLEFYRGDAPGYPLLGVARDSAGNVFKVVQ